MTGEQRIKWGEVLWDLLLYLFILFRKRIMVIDRIHQALALSWIFLIGLVCKLVGVLVEIVLHEEPSVRVFDEGFVGFCGLSSSGLDNLSSFFVLVVDRLGG